MWIKPVLSAIVSGIYFITNVAALHATESNFWAERRRGLHNKSGSPMLMAGLSSSQTTIGANFLQQFPSIDRHAFAPTLSATITKSLPLNFSNKNASLLQALSSSYGSIRKITVPSSAQTVPPRIVVHIQDVHQNADAQKNIGQVVQSLVDHDQVGLVALEGAFKPIDLSGFRSFSRQDVLKRWADYLLRTNRISGPIFSALTGAKAFPKIAGVDDPTHYNANVEAYRSSAPRMQEYKDKIAALQSELNNKKATLFNPALLAFDRSVQSYVAGKIGLGEHFKILADQVPANTLTQGAKDFLKALAMESAINFQQVEKDRTQLVERLVQKLDKKQTDTLIQWSVAYRAGQVRYADFYKSLKDLCENNGLPLASFPAMNEYIRYVLLADGIDPEQLLADMTALEKSAYARLTKTAEEKQIVERSNALMLTGKLVDFSLTPTEYEEYTKTSIPDFPKDELLMFENFYKQAHARDQAMTDNLVKSMADSKTDTAVLVTGGFHSPGMAEKLEHAGFTVISFTPKIEKIDTSKGSAYLSVFTQEKTPLEKMFKGEKLFLAQNPADGLNSAPAELSAGVAVANVKNGSTLSEIEQDVQHVVTELSQLGLSPGDLLAPKVDIQESGDNLLVTVEITQDGNTRQVQYTVTFDKEGAYYKVDSAEILGFRGQIVEFAREIAPASAEDMVARVKHLFDLGHSEAIAEIPILSGLPGMALAEILWVLNLHQARNIDRSDLAARIVKLELLRQISLVAEAGRWVVNATAAQALLGSKISEVTELSQTEGGMGSEISKAVAHYVLNHNPNGTDRLGMLNLGQWSTVFPMLDQAYYRNIILKPPLRDLLKREPTTEEIETIIKEALRRKTNPANILKEIHSYPDFAQWVQGMSLRHDLILLKGFAIGIESGVQAFQSDAERQQIVAALEHVGRDVLREGSSDESRNRYSNLGFDDTTRELFESEVIPRVKNFVEGHDEREAPQRVKTPRHDDTVLSIEPSLLTDEEFLANHPIVDADILRRFKGSSAEETIALLIEIIRLNENSSGQSISDIMARVKLGQIGVAHTIRLQKMVLDKTGELLSQDEIMRMPIAQVLLRLRLELSADYSLHDVSLAKSQNKPSSSLEHEQATAVDSTPQILSADQAVRRLGGVTFSHAIVYNPGGNEKNRIEKSLVQTGIELGMIVSYQGDIKFYFAEKPDGFPYSADDIKSAMSQESNPIKEQKSVAPKAGTEQESPLSGEVDVVNRKIGALWGDNNLVSVNDLDAQVSVILRKAGERSDEHVSVRARQLQKELVQVRRYISIKGVVREGFRMQFPGIYLNGTPPEMGKYSLEEIQTLESRLGLWVEGIKKAYTTKELEQNNLDRLHAELDQFISVIHNGIEQRRMTLKGEAIARIARLEALQKNIAEGKVLNAAHVFDIHGDPAILDEVIADVEAGQVQEVIFHGDAFDRGANNLGVFDRFKKLKELLGDRFVMILGNHDVWMIEALLMNDDQAMANWLLNGGDALFKEAGFNRDFAQMVGEGRNAGNLPASFDYLRNDARMKPLLQIAGWMLANQKLFHVDDRGFMHIHAGIPVNDDGKPRINRQQLEAAQEKLQALQSSLVVGQELQFSQKNGLAEILEEMKGIFWIREEGWLDRILTQPGGALKIDARHQAEVDQIKALLVKEIRRQMPAGETMSEPQMNDVVNRHLPTALAQFNIPYEIVRPKADPEKLQELLDAFDVQGIMFGHNHHAQVQNIDARIIGADVDQNVFVRADARGIRVRDMRKSEEDTLIDRKAILSRLQSQIDALRQKAGVPAAKSSTPVADTPQKTEPARSLDVEPKAVRFSKGLLASTFQQVRWSWGNGAISIHARVSTNDPSLIRLSPRVGRKSLDTITLQEGQSLYVGTLNGAYALSVGREMPRGMALSRKLTNESGRISVATTSGATSPTVAQLIPDIVALSAKKINPQQHAADLLARFILAYALENHQTSTSRVRNTWLSSDVLGYGLFVGVSAALMTFFGLDLETLSSPLKALLLTAAVPLSMVTTSTLGVAALFELSARRKDPKVWAKKHGVQEGSAQYNAYMESAESIAAAGRAAAAAGKSVTWAEIKEQSRLNIQYLMSLFKRQGRPAQGPTAEETPTDVSVILETMPDAKKGTFSAADVFGAITNTGSNLQGIAKNAVQGMSEETRRRVSNRSGALSWLMEVSQIDTNAVALLPLPSTLMGRGDLDQIVDNALAMHKNAVFYVESGVNVPGAFMRYIESKDDRVELIRLSAGVKLFDNQELMMAVLEQNAPHNAPNVQPYLPDEYTANATGVKDEKRFGDKSVLPMSLVLMFKRMIELANFIATQA